MSNRTPAALAAMFCGMLIAPALAHITLEVREAPAGSTYKAVLRLPHGCDAAATTAIRVRIPEGVTGIKPMPKPGWALATRTAPVVTPVATAALAATPDGHAAPQQEVVEVAWSGGNLPDAYYDEFVLRMTLPKAAEATTIYFPIVQECGATVTRWIEIPVQGAAEPDHPAPALRIVPAPAR